MEFRILAQKRRQIGGKSAAKRRQIGVNHFRIFAPSHAYRKTLLNRISNFGAKTAANRRQNDAKLASIIFEFWRQVMPICCLASPWISY
jgi:hypothetical protein